MTTTTTTTTTNHNNNHNHNNNRAGGLYDVVVVGAGAAGMYAGDTLRAMGVDNFLILEAGDAPGGRVRSAHGLAPWPVCDS